MIEKEVKNGKGIKKILIVILIILAIGAAAFTGYFFATKKNPNKANNSVPSNNVTNNTQGIMLENLENFQLGEFLVNLNDTEEKKYLKVNIFLGYPKENKKIAEELKNKQPVLRDTVNLILRSKKSADINEKGVEQLKKEILDKINVQIANGQVINVYFDSIIVQ